MKRIIYLIVFLVFSLSSYAERDTTVVVDDIKEQTLVVKKSDNDSIQAAIEAYNEGDFYRAISLIENEVKNNQKIGLESPMLFYNLGNAYFRVNELGHARLNYERAALLAPSDRDINHNIEYVTSRIEDKILEVDTLFVSAWFNGFQNFLDADAWAIAGIVCFLVLIGCLVVFFFTQQILLKKITFYLGLIAVIFVIFSNVFAFRQKHKIEKRSTAVIMAASTAVVSSPDINSKELFRLHVGTKVNITKDDRNWLEIEIADGSVGWIQRDKLEVI